MERRRSAASSTVLSQKVSGLLYCGLVAGPVFVLAFLIEGATRGDGYRVLRHPVSSLALGHNGWMQTANFLLCGCLTIAFAVGLWRSRSITRAGAVLIGIWGIGLLGAGAFITDPVNGYPVGTPDAVSYTTSGALHDGFSLPAFLALAAAQLVVARGHGWKWATYSVLSAVAFLATFFLSSIGFSQTEPFIGVGGLFQRIAVSIGWAWTVAVAWRSTRRPT